jgi:hypothetical protein
MRFFVTIIILCLPVFLFGGAWDGLDVSLIETAPSAEKGSTKYILRDGKGQPFEVNYATVPDETKQKRVLALKDLYYGWGKISLERIEFYFSSEGIYSNLQTSKIEYKGENLLPYLPAGLAFQDTSDGLNYRFRIVVKNKSYMIEGRYTDEETLLKRIYDFIKTREDAVPENVTTATVREQEREKVQHRISVCVLGTYMKPIRKLGEVFSGGYGGMAGLTIHDVGLSLNNRTLFNMDFTLASGYRKLSAKDDFVSSKVNSAYIIPVCLYARFPIRIGGGFSVVPLAGVGYNYNSIDYVERSSIGASHVKKIRVWAPSLSAGALLSYQIIENKVNLLGGVEYSATFERYMTSHVYMFHVGAEYSFMTFGN